MTSLTFHVGVNEIGGNKILLEDKDAKVFLDFGKDVSNIGHWGLCDFQSININKNC